MVHITKKEAREYLLKYQALSDSRKLESDEEIVNFIRKIGCIQYDPLNKAARNADLVLQSRCKNYSEDILYRLLYEKRELIDGWDKNMSIWAITDWPKFARKRIGHLDRYQKRTEEFSVLKNEIMKKIKENGYISSKDIHGNQKVHWSWSPTDIGRATLESLYHSGELVIHHKKGARKFYGLTEDLLPRSIIHETDPNITSDDYHEWYVKRRISSIGLLWNRSGDAWLGSNLKKEERSQSIRRLLEKNEIREIKIAGINEIFYMPKKELTTLHDNEELKTASIIAPLDNLMWDRKMISAIFNFDYKWEVYTPVKERKFGYYVLPVIYGGKFIGRFEPVVNRKSKELHIENWWWEDGIKIKQDMMDALTRCLVEFGKFLHVERISISDTLIKDKLEWAAHFV